MFSSDAGESSEQHFFIICYLYFELTLTEHWQHHSIQSNVVELQCRCLKGELRTQLLQLVTSHKIREDNL